MFKECLRHGIMPFIIDDKRRSRYLRGIKEWHDDRFEMIDVVMEAQDRFEAQIELQRLTPQQASFSRLYPIRRAYSEEDLRAIISGDKKHVPHRSRTQSTLKISAPEYVLPAYFCKKSEGDAPMIFRKARENAAAF